MPICLSEAHTASASAGFPWSTAQIAAPMATMTWACVFGAFWHDTSCLGVKGVVKQHEMWWGAFAVDRVSSHMSVVVVGSVNGAMLARVDANT
jgi:hypothetical protein